MYENNLTRFIKNHENVKLEEKFEIYFENNYVVFEDSVMDLQDILFYTSVEFLFSEITSWCALNGETPYLIVIDKNTEEIECFKDEKDFDEWRIEIFVYWLQDILTTKFNQIYNIHDSIQLQVMRMTYTWEYYHFVEKLNEIINEDEKVIAWIDKCTK